ncbi:MULTISPECIES: tetratricopeptide repeat protein [Methylobacterium]|uniref:tetratricopeptide repeat protein n=1 Tax=Methylobacterium TaxID=407 RepID=UPI001050EBB4|nr:MULTISPECIES: tetratricopeptide repeat protein [Methylobacterium]MDR7038240.1 putative TPR repeat methyltransferase [Methylobacterium sp. BE186]
MAGSSAPNAEDEGLSLAEALDIALRAHQAGDGAVAETVYRRILDVAPESADALHYLAILLHQTGRSVEAIRLMERAIEIEPDEAGLHNNLGNILFELDQPEIALKVYERVLLLEPGHTNARNNLGVTLRVLRRPDEAEAVYREAIALDPEHREAWDNLGRLLASRGRIQEAIGCHAKALELEPNNAGSRRFIVAAYTAAGVYDRALEILQAWRRDEPDNPSVHHLIASISGVGVPERASDRYVEALFDGFANSFDHKLARLDYRAPELCAASVAEAYPRPAADLAVLDAGCGTGLCGPLLRPYARDLGGVDLSGKMLEKAAARGLYDALERAELTAYLAARPGAYDLVLSADTLCYFGALDAVLAAARTALRPGGRFVFSVEALEEAEGTRLNAHGRYSHAKSHVEAAAGAAGFSIEAIDRVVLRLERAEPVTGYVVRLGSGDRAP